MKGGVGRQPDLIDRARPDAETVGSLGVVVRPRLLGAPSALAPLTLVSAPAGYGKTVLVDSWAARARTEDAIVWMDLDEEAADPELFWIAALDALRRSGIDVSGVRPGRTHRDALTSLVHCIEAHDTHVVWILDLGESSLSAAVARGLDGIMRRLTGSLAVVVLTRSDPPLPLSRYRLGGLLTDIRAADLVFTLGETAELMKRHGLDLPTADLAALHAWTGGWPAGLRFAGMSLRAGDDTQRSVLELRGDVGNIAEYLMSEVLSKQTEETRQFLLATCVADELVPGLVEELWGQPCDLHTLEVMAQRSGFLELVPGRTDRFRCSTLFREFLNAQLAFESPELLDDLHRSAASWLAHDGQVFAAIRHAVHAQAWPMAAELFVEHLGYAELLTGRRGGRLRALLDDLPAETPGTAAAVVRATLSLCELDPETGERHLAAARGPADAPPLLALAVSVLTAVAASLGDDTDAGLGAALVAEKAIRLASTREETKLLELDAIVSGCKARVLFERGDLAAGALALSRGVTSAESANLDVVAGELKGMAALVAAATGRLRHATELALEVSPGATGPADGTAGSGLEAATLALAWVRTDESEHQLARDLLDQAGGQLASYDSRVLDAVLSLLRARVLKDEGEFALALAQIRGALEPVGSAFGTPVTGWLAELLVGCEARSLLALGRPEEALAMLQSLAGHDAAGVDVLLQRALVATGVEKGPSPVSETSLTGTSLGLEVDRWIFMAERSLAQQDAGRAESFLERALRLAQPEHLRRPFRRAGEEVRALLRSSGLAEKNLWLRQEADTEDEPGAWQVPVQRSEPGGTAQTPFVMPLTAKENEVLGHLAELLTTEEIAATMFVSVNTVRSHVRSILRKLGVGRRNEAVRRAWGLGLLPSAGASSSTSFAGGSSRL